MKALLTIVGVLTFIAKSFSVIDSVRAKSTKDVKRESKNKGRAILSYTHFARAKLRSLYNTVASDIESGGTQ